MSKEPKLRYKLFKDDWEIDELGNLSDVRDGTHDSPSYYKSGYPLITSKNLLPNGLIDFDNVNFISEEDYSNINKRSKVDENDILFGMIGTIGNPVIVKSEGFAIKNVALIKEEKPLKNKFLIYLMQSPFINKQFANQKAGGTQKFIALGKIRKLLICYPSISEQEKLACFLSKVDDKIVLLSNKYEKLNKFKEGLIDKIINHLIINNELVLFSNIYTKASEGGTPSTTIKEYYENGNIPFIKVDDLENKYLTEAKDFITEEGLKNSSAWLINENSIIYSNGATIGNISISKFPIATKQGIIGFELNDKFNPEFIYYLMSSTYFKKEIEKITTQGTMKTAYLKDINNIKIPKVSLEEQIKKISLLGVLDKKIELISYKIEYYDRFKKSLLQQMFV